MKNSLKSTAIHALFWSFAERFGQQSVQFVISVILARLLLPEQFGLIGMLAIFMAIAQSFINSGFGQALIQRKIVTHLDECTVFYFNIFVGFISAGLLFLCAQLIADFYNQPVLTALTQVLSLNLVINSFGLIQTTLLTKCMDFKTQLQVSLLATFLSGLIGITMAIMGYGLWSLVAQSISSNLFRTILLWFFNSWRPSLIFSLKALSSMFSFGSRLLASGLLENVFQNIYHVIIGKLFLAANLGFFTRAKTLQELPTKNVSAIVNRVAFPIFSLIQDDVVRTKHGMRKALTTLSFLIFPIMIGLAVVAKPLITVLLTEKWLPSVLYLQLLCVVGLFYPIQALNLSVLNAKGRSDLVLRVGVLKKIIIVISIAITYRWGISALICGQIVVSLFGYYINSYYIGKMINYPCREQIRDFAPYLALSVSMGMAVYSMQWIPGLNNLIILCMQIIVGIIFYLAMSFVFKISAFVELSQIIKNKIRQLNLQNTKHIL